MTLSKAKLVDKLSQKNFSYNKNTIYDMVCDFVDILEESLIKDGSLKLSGFGNFTVVNKGARVGRNPQTSKELIISRRKVVTFHSSTKLKQIINPADSESIITDNFSALLDNDIIAHNEHYEHDEHEKHSEESSLSDYIEDDDS